MKFDLKPFRILNPLEAKAIALEKRWQQYVGRETVMKLDTQSVIIPRKVFSVVRDGNAVAVLLHSATPEGFTFWHDAADIDLYGAP